MGRIYARRLASEGYRVAIVDINEMGLQQTAEAEGDFFSFVCDISSDSAVAKCAVAVADALGAIDYFVHCAALMPAISVQHETPDSVERLTRVNYFGTINLIEHMIKPMVARGCGVAVIFGSIAGWALVPNMASYCASKAAVNAYTESLINELKLAGSSLQVSLVMPPAVNTPLIDQTLETETPGSILSAKESGRLADPGVIVADIMRQAAAGRAMIYPGSAKKLLYWHFFFPRLWWRIVGGFEKNLTTRR